MTWTNPPAASTERAGELEVVTDEFTDFWRSTAYGFIHDTGHFLHRDAAGDFSLDLTFRGNFDYLYDQAGLMLRQGPGTWLKAGVERYKDALRASVVNTLGVSDWSISPPLSSSNQIRLHVTRSGDAVAVRIGHTGADLDLIRLAPFPVGGTTSVGPMCCSPKRGGLVVTFSQFAISDPDEALY